jgi:4-hydroxy-tetrahydrodipicolinate synthase
MTPAGAPRADRASTYVISITPFADNGSLDEAGLRAHLRRIANAGIGVYLGGGGSGEGYTLSSDEARRVLEIGVEELRGKVAVRSMGAEPRTAAEMVEYVRLAESAGVDATQIYSLDQGHGHRPTRKEIQTYFDDVLSSTTLPTVVSTHQSVGYKIPLDLLAGLASRPNVIGINCTHADLRYLADVVDIAGDQVDVHVGGPQLALTGWSLGATGYLSSEANLAPELCASLVTAYRSGDAALTAIFGTLLRLSTALYGAGGIRATKGVLNRLGLPGGSPRKPQLPVDEATVDTLLQLIRELDVAPAAT